MPEGSCKNIPSTDHMSSMNKLDKTYIRITINLILNQSAEIFSKFISRTEVIFYVCSLKTPMQICRYFILIVKFLSCSPLVPLPLNIKMIL